MMFLVTALYDPIRIEEEIRLHFTDNDQKRKNKPQKKEYTTTTFLITHCKIHQEENKSKLRSQSLMG